MTTGANDNEVVVSLERFGFSELSSGGIFPAETIAQ